MTKRRLEHLPRENERGGVKKKKKKRREEEGDDVEKETGSS